VIATRFAGCCVFWLHVGFAFCLLLHARLAQPAERKALNLVVVGSSPTVGVLVLPALGLSAGRAGCEMDTLGIEPRAFRMQSGCDTTTPCAQHSCYT
jgi:hypothetical protein